MKTAPISLARQNEPSRPNGAGFGRLVKESFHILRIEQKATHFAASSLARPRPVAGVLVIS